MADAKQNLSELLGRVAYGGETVTITKRGRPMAKLVPMGHVEANRHPCDLKGWLTDDDAFFDAIDEVVATRGARLPRVYGRRASRRRR